MRAARAVDRAAVGGGGAAGVLTRRRFAAGGVLVAVASGAGCFTWSHQVAERGAVERLSWIKARVRRQFPDAPQLSTGDFQRRLDAGEAFVVLDVRGAEEFAVSHLPGAIRVDPDAEPALPAGVAADVPVLAYCSVGWRSSKWVEGLRRRGVDAVNLEGSIFQWAAEDRPLESGGEPVAVVHPYSRAWAWLVDPERRAFETTRP